MKSVITTIINCLLANKTAFMWSAISLFLCFITVGIPAIIFYVPVSMLLSFFSFDQSVVDKVNGDNVWSMLILTSFIASLLIVPAHLMIRRYFPLLARWKHVLSTLIVVWLMGNLIMVVLMFAYIS